MRATLIGVAVSTVCVAGAAGQPCIPQWSGAFPAGDTDGPVYASLLYDDGTGSAVYIGGGFSRVGGVAARGVAKWNGTTWSAVGPGFDGPVHALTIHNDGSGPGLYAGGLFSAVGATPANCIAKWNGSAWSAFGPVSGTTALVGGPVRAMISFVENNVARLFVGGDSLRLGTGSPSSQGIFRWMGTSWQQAGSGTLGIRVLAFATNIESTIPRLYAAGRTFTGIGGPVLRWEGSGWSSSGPLMPASAVNALVSYDAGSGPALYAASEGQFVTGQPSVRLARLMTGSWQPVANGPDQAIRTLAVADVDGLGGQPPVLVAGGAFTSVAGTPAERIAMYNGSTWSVPAAGVNGAPSTMLTFSQGGVQKVLVGGGFSLAGGQPAPTLAAFSAAGWSAVAGTAAGMGLNGPARAMAWFDDDGPGPNAAKLYVAGEFNAAGGQIVNGIATWNGAAWSGLAGGANGTVHALRVHTDASGTSLYAGGEFTVIGGVAANRVARWDGAAWHALGSGLGLANVASERVLSLDTYTPAGQTPRLAAGGFFVPPGTSLGQGVATWDGHSWAALGPSTNITGATSIAAFDDGSGPALFAAGGTYFVSGVQYVVKWNGTSWTAIPAGLNPGSYISTLLVHDGGSGAVLYGAGSSLIQVGLTYENIAKWDGASWTAAGPDGPAVGPTTAINALATYDDGSGPALYAGGSFQTSNSGAPMRHLARLKNGVWSEVAGDFRLPRGAAVNCMASAPGPTLFVGGSFVEVGGVSAGNITGLTCGCYANCDGSTAAPVLNVQDFGCFLNAFANAEPYANCDGSTVAPALNVQDFGCFLNAFAAGCP